MKQKLYFLKMQILKDLSIKDNLKKDLAEQIFQIEQELAINYTHSCTSEAEQLKCECKANYQNLNTKTKVERHKPLFFVCIVV